MDYAQLIELYFERSRALQNYWTLYVVIIGGLLAVSSLRQIPNRLTTILVTVLFCCFAYKNCGALIDTTNQRRAALEAVKAADAVKLAATASGHAGMPASDVVLREQLVPAMVGPDAGGVRRFHYTCDALTILTLWSMEWRRRRRERELKAAAA